jgi:hypothetical protein
MFLILLVIPALTAGTIAVSVGRLISPRTAALAAVAAANRGWFTAGFSNLN